MTTLRLNSVPLNSYVRAIAISCCVAALSAIGCSVPGTLPQILFSDEQVLAGIKEGQSAMLAGNAQLAEETLLDALKHAQAKQDDAGIAVIHGHLGYIYQETGRHKEALDAWVVALPYVRTIRHRALEAEILGELAWAEDELGNAESALTSYNQSLKIWDEVLSDASEPERQLQLKRHALTLFRKADAHKKLVQYVESVNSYRRAAQDYKSIGDDDGAGVSLWLAATIVEEKLMDQEQAMGLYAEAVPLLLAANNRESAGLASVSLGKMYIAAGKFSEAREILLNAITLGESLNLSAVVFSANYALATAFDNGGEFDQALPHYEAVIEQIRKGEYKEKDNEIYLYALKRAAFIYTILSKYDLAIQYWRTAAIKYGERADTEMEADTHTQLAELYVSLGDFETAVEHLRQILAIIRKNHADSNDARFVAAEAGILAAIGDTLSLGGKASTGEIAQYFQDARKLLASYMGFGLLNEAQKATKLSGIQRSEPYEVLQKSLTTLDTNIRTIVRALFFSWGRISLKEGEPDTAISMLSIALACDSLSARSASPLGNATLKIREGLNSYYLAEALRQKKDFALARRFLFAAEKVAAEFRSPLINFAYAGLAKTYADQGDFITAVNYYKKGFQILESVQYQQITEQKKIELLEGSLSEYRGLVVSLLDLFNQTHEESYLREAFEYNEKLKARTFLEILGNSKVSRLGTDAGALTARQEKVRRQIGFTNERLKNRNLDLKGANNLLIQLQTLQQEWQSVQREIANQDSRYDQIVYPKPATISEVQAALSDDAVLLEYSTSPDGSKLWAITREEVQVYNLPGEKNFPSLDAYLKTLREPLMDRVLAVRLS